MPRLIKLLCLCLFWIALPLAAQEQEDEKKWDVNNPPGPPGQVDIDTIQGTWLYLDLSPDGQTIVFSLLGDLYTMPATGGDAQAITSGMAWDMQPRFSPDGSQIAFISDRDGADNLWLIDTSGANPKQVSKETFRLVHNPAWVPDGRYLAARKHFTKTRSMGAGEIWLYHVDGGEGLQVVEKLNDEKDINDPALSPDGRYLYYTLDVTPGERFEYGKDPHQGIYEIRRLDRMTGESITYVSGTGGAVRPLPSPDGNSLAFIKRLGYQTTLFIKDIRSGVETPVYQQLDRDNQEIWAIHGLYPNMAWSADSQSLLFWADGGIKKLAVATQAVSDIPFRVRDQREIREALLFAVDPQPESFNTKMLRWIKVSPDGRKVVFQALGYLWIQDLNDGKPKRLTRQKDHFELYPSFSRDSKSVVYTTWSDAELGSVRVVSARGGRGAVVTPDPGHYVDPQFSPDGQAVVYQKLAGNLLTSPWWGEQPGIYEGTLDGGAPDLITTDGRQPHYGSSSSYLYLTRTTEDGPALVQINFSTRQESELAKSEYATEYAVSPDGQWLAFGERFKAYVTPMVALGNALSVSPKMSSQPVHQIAKDAGEYIHWSGDSQTVYWSTGPVLSATQPAIIAELENEDGEAGDSTETAETDDNTQTYDLGFSFKPPVPTGTVAFVGARIITMRGDEIIENGVVVVEGNQIVSVGAASEIDVPRGAHVVSASGKVLMPGLVDAHWHGPQGSNEIVPQQNWINFASLAFGVTTIHDPSNDTSTVFAAREMALAGTIVAPRIFSTGTILYGATTGFTAQVESLDDALGHLRRLKAAGAHSVKSYNQPRRNQRQQIIAAARELELNVYPEGGAFFEHNMNMIADGHTGIEHSLVVADIYQDVLQYWPQTNVGYTPTLVVSYGGIEGERFWYRHDNVYEHDRLTRFVPRELLDREARRRVIAPDDEYNHFSTARHVNQLSEAGVSVQIGAHGQREGLGAHWEMWMLAQGGMSPHNVLRAATIDGARYLGMDQKIGSIETGKLADLILLDADPLQNIRNSEKIGLVMINGHLYDAATMNEVGNHPRQRQPFWWEQPGQ